MKVAHIALVLCVVAAVASAVVIKRLDDLEPNAPLPHKKHHSSSSSSTSSTSPNNGTIRPVVLWHGMGDDCCDPLSMGAVKDEIQKTLPGVYVYSVMIGVDPVDDRIQSFISNVNDQVAFVCEYVKNDPNLANGFNAIGFSQGGQFLRGYVERCNDPPVHNLITFGGQHQGVSDFPDCVDTNETLCKLVAELCGEGAYAPFVRDHLVQAQYFKDPMDNSGYLDYNIFLADINNAHNESQNATYKENLKSLNKFVMIKFENDTIVVPRESEWFGAYALGSLSTVLTMEEQDIYKEDWIGLKEMNENGQIVQFGCPGNHMQFTMDYLKTEVIVPYLTNYIDE